MATTLESRQCAKCGRNETYVYNGRPSWHKTQDGKYLCHSCYSSRSKAEPDVEVVWMAEAKEAVAKAKTPEECRQACKRFTNRMEAKKVKEREAAKVA